MSLRYLPEHAENTALALELARKEAAHLHFRRPAADRGTLLVLPSG